METGCYEDLYVCIRLCGTNAPQDDWGNDFGWNRARVIRTYEDNVFLPFTSSSSLGEPIG